MHVYRIADRKYVADLSGTGARMFGGRWNRKGTPILYTSASRSLAILELLTHVSLHTLPPSLAMMSLDIPVGCSIEDLVAGSLPGDWFLSPPAEELAEMGTRWAQDNRSLALRVPSAIVREEFNILINPRHAEFGRIIPGTPEPFAIDERLFAARTPQVH